VELPDLVEFGDPAEEPGVSPQRGLRWGLTYAAGLRALLDLWHGSDDIDRCRLGAVAMQGNGGGFLARQAGGGLHLLLTREEQLVATRRVLGLPEPRCWLNRQCPGCSQGLDSDREAALHYPACPGPMLLAPGASRAGDVYGSQVTHIALIKAVGRIITETGSVVVEEVPGLFEDSAERPGDCTVLGFHDGHRHLAIDVNCTRLLTNTHLQAAGVAPGSALEATEERKRRRYAELLERAGGTIAFVPFITDEYGAIGDHGQQLLEVLADRMTARPGGAGRRGQTTAAARAETIGRWRNYIAVAVHRAQARIIIEMTARAGRDATGVKAVEKNGIPFFKTERNGTERNS
jgi:hypothetical protein